MEIYISCLTISFVAGFIGGWVATQYYQTLQRKYDNERWNSIVFAGDSKND